MSKEMSSPAEQPALGKRKRARLLLMAALLALIALGIWKGDYHETLINGTTL